MFKILQFMNPLIFQLVNHQQIFNQLLELEQEQTHNFYMLFMIKENHQQNQLTNTKLVEQKNVKDGGF